MCDYCETVLLQQVLTTFG